MMPVRVKPLARRLPTIRPKSREKRAATIAMLDSFTQTALLLGVCGGRRGEMSRSTALIAAGGDVAEVDSLADSTMQKGYCLVRIFRL